MKKLFLLLSATLGIFLVWFVLALRPVDSSDTKAQGVTIEQGSGVAVIANLLEERRLIRSSFAFKLSARWKGVSTKLQAGSFALSPSQSASEIIEMLQSGKTEEFNVTIPEGYLVADIDALMASKGLGAPGDIIDCAFRCDFETFDFLPTTAGATAAEQIGSRLEGYLFPETYSVSSLDYHPKFFLERMLGTFRSRVVTKYAEDIEASGRTLHEIVTMASLVEKESRRDDERATVAGILWKRLENGVVLGVDAVTRYAVKKPKQPLTKIDLETPSPYNTRRTQGLPPSPIANAGEKSFIAVLHPEESPYWYYLHDPQGIIRFAVTNDEHNLNKARYLR